MAELNSAASVGRTDVAEEIQARVEASALAPTPRSTTTPEKVPDSGEASRRAVAPDFAVDAPTPTLGPSADQGASASSRWHSYFHFLQLWLLGFLRLWFKEVAVIVEVGDDADATACLRFVEAELKTVARSPPELVAVLVRRKHLLISSPGTAARRLDANALEEFERALDAEAPLLDVAVHDELAFPPRGGGESTGELYLSFCKLSSLPRELFAVRRNTQDPVSEPGLACRAGPSQAGAAAAGAAATPTDVSVCELLTGMQLPADDADLAALQEAAVAAFDAPQHQRRDEDDSSASSAAATAVGAAAPAADAVVRLWRRGKLISRSLVRQPSEPATVELLMAPFAGKTATGVATAYLRLRALAVEVEQAKCDTKRPSYGLHRFDTEMPTATPAQLEALIATLPVILSWWVAYSESPTNPHLLAMVGGEANAEKLEEAMAGK